MAGNDNFPTLAAENTAMLASFGIYKIARTNAVNGGVEATAIRDARRADLVELLQAMVGNASAVANGNEEMLMSGGLPLQKATRSPIGPLSAPLAPK